MSMGLKGTHESEREGLLGGDRSPRGLLGKGHIARVRRPGLATHLLCDVGPRFSYMTWVVVVELVV